MEPPFRRADLDGPLDVEVTMRAIPEEAVAKGMMLGAVARWAEQHRIRVPGMRARYIPFADYPLREHAALLVEAARAFHPDKPLRRGLWHVGRYALWALRGSMVGRVISRDARTMPDLLEAMREGYATCLSHGRVEAVEVGTHSAIVRLTGVYHFLDCHHVGVFEGLLRELGVEGEATLRLHSPTAGDIHLEWR